MLKIKESPRQLEPTTLEIVWPGDDAVDLEASDLAAWARDGGQEGLVIKPGGKPAIIRARSLSPRGMSRAIRLLDEREPTFASEAFRHGVISIDGVDLGWTRIGGERGLSDAALEYLGQEVMPLPYLVLLTQLRVAMGQEVEQKKTDDFALSDTSLPDAIGLQVLSATFRRGRRAP